MTKATAGERRNWLDRLLGRNDRMAGLPPGLRIYAIGDVHGRDDLLCELLEAIRAHASGEPRQNGLVFLGDYVDRGGQSKAVIDRLLDLDRNLEGWNLVFLRGNHDQVLLDFLEDPAVYRVWRGFGAAETLLSYGVMPPRFDDTSAMTQARDAFAEACPRRHIEFLRNLEYFHECGNYLFVHAGLRPGLALERQSHEDMMWIRDEFLSSDRDFGRIVVHGHTPTAEPVRRFNRIGVDTGAYATGHLTAAVLEGTDCTFLSVNGKHQASSIGKEMAV